MSKANEYLQLMDTIKTMEDDFNSLKNVVQQSVIGKYCVTKEIFNAILILKKEDIEKFSVDQVKDFLLKYMDKDKIKAAKLENSYPDSVEVVDIEKECSLFIDRLIEFEVTDIKALAGVSDNNNSEPDFELEAAINIITDIKDQQLSIMESYLSLRDVKKESMDAVQTYMDAINSDEIREKNESHIKEIQEELKTLTDEVAKKKLQTKLEIIESMHSFSFIFKRINEYGEKELSDIMEGFFNEQKGSYIIKKYVSKIKLFGYNKEIYKNFFNIEENFLNEQYHPFNNLFLFIYMKFAAYADPYNNRDKMCVQSLTTNLCKLFYHTFTTSSVEEEFINVIKKILDNFSEYKETFEKGNTTAPMHPRRVEMIQKREEVQKKAIVDLLDNMGVMDYPKDLPYKELKAWYENFVDMCMEEQRKKDDNVGKTIDITEEAEDGSVTIEPRLSKTDENVIASTIATSILNESSDEIVNTEK